MTLSFLVGSFGPRPRLSLHSLSTNSANKNLPRDLNYSDVEQVYDTLKEKFDGKLDSQKLLDGVKKGLVEASGDPYTNYLTPEEAKIFQSDLKGSFEGIGAQLGSESGRPIVIAPIDGAPAQAAGLKPKDVIVSIDSKDTSDMTLEQAVQNIRGAQGTKVKLKVLRGKDSLDIEITRAEIKMPSVSSEIIDDGKIGYLRLSQFGADTDELADKAAQDFKSKGVKGVILDLRNNPGGYLSSSTRIAGLWIHDQTVVEEKRDGKTIESLKATGTPTLQGLPTIVLVNDGSASASEIVSGALQDYGLAQLVGTKTFGKGSVQEPTDLGDGGMLKVTIAHWYTPKGKNIDKEGIKPDVEVAADGGPDDVQKAKAIEVLHGKGVN